MNVAWSLLKDLGESNNEFQDYLKNLNKHSLFLKEVDPEEVHNLESPQNSQNYQLNSLKAI